MTQKTFIFDTTAEVAAVCVLGGCTGGYFHLSHLFKLFARRHPTKQAGDVEGQLDSGWQEGKFS